MNMKFHILKNLFTSPYDIRKYLINLNQLMVLSEIERIRKSSRYSSPKNLLPFGYKIYSQSDEDGILREIFNRIGVTNRTFLEIGVGNGLENNTVAFLFEKWKGLWLESSAKSTRKIEKNYANVIKSGHLKVINSFVTKENINDLISWEGKEIDLLSIDIDGNDAHVFEAITSITPRVVVIEYNAKFPPPIVYCMKYNATYIWKKDDCLGASLKYLEILFAEKGYCLIGCNITGVNAFFVRKDLVGDKFESPYTAEKHFEPARYYLATGFKSGHPSAYSTLENIFIMQNKLR
jgi:hypothetical protein